MAELTPDQVKQDEDAKAAAAAAKATAADSRTPSAGDIAEAIKGLRFRTNKAIPVLDDATGQPIVEGGKEKVRYIADLRPMKRDDVLKAYMADGQLVIVAKDGSKHRLNKGGKAA